MKTTKQTPLGIVTIQRTEEMTPAKRRRMAIAGFIGQINFFDENGRECGGCNARSEEEFAAVSAMTRVEHSELMRALAAKANESSRVRRLAVLFSKLLREDLGDDVIASIVRLNAEERNPNVCHSHDFCDANEVMIDAWTRLGFEDPFKDDGMENAELTARWEAAWNMAKADGFDAPKIEWPYSSAVRS